jgi:hypothetical protein
LEGNTYRERRFNDLELGFCKKTKIGEADIKFITIFYNRDTRAIINEGKNVRGDGYCRISELGQA